MNREERESALFGWQDIKGITMTPFRWTGACNKACNDPP